MTGEQLTFYERVDEIRRRLRNGDYGEDDDVDADSLNDDLEEVTFA